MSSIDSTHEKRYIKPMRGKPSNTGTEDSSKKITFSAPPPIMNAIEELAEAEGLQNNRSAYLCVLITREHQRRFGGVGGPPSSADFASDAPLSALQSAHRNRPSSGPDLNPELNARLDRLDHRLDTLLRRSGSKKRPRRVTGENATTSP
jgi:hypothetical protein